MGLDVRVRCTCVRDGLVPPHPSPEKLRFDENGEPFLECEGDYSWEEWRAHEKWLNEGCVHGGRLVDKRLGHMMRIVHVRSFLEFHAAPGTFPILQDGVVYSGIHCGDSINARDAAALLDEIRHVQQLQLDDVVSEFVTDLTEVCDASILSGNPIVF